MKKNEDNSTTTPQTIVTESTDNCDTHSQGICFISNFNVGVNDFITLNDKEGEDKINSFNLILSIQRDFSIRVAHERK